MLKSVLKMQEMPFQRPKIQTFSGGYNPRPPTNVSSLFNNVTYFVLPQKNPKGATDNSR